MKKTTIAKALFAIVTLVVIAALSAFVQSMMFGEHNVAATSVIVSISALSLWRALWKTAR